MSKFFDISKLKTLAAGLVASGKKNAPTLMTAGSIIAGWVGVYIFWKESRKVEQKIEFEEALLNADEDIDILPEERKKLPTKEKLILYAQYCWPAAVLGLTSTGLAIGANSINLSRLAEMALLTQFMTDKDEKQKKLIEKLKGEVGDKKFLEMKDELRDEEYPREDILKEVEKIGVGSGKTLFIDQVTGNHFTADILDVTTGIANFNSRLKEKRTKAVRDRMGDAFFSSDNPWSLDLDKESEVYSTLDVSVFMQCIGETPSDEDAGIGELLEFRYYGGGGDVVKPNQILQYKKYTDPESGLPVVCYLDYRELLSPTSELLERNPI